MLEETEGTREDMSESHLDPSDWLGIVATSLITGIGGAMAWFTGTKNKIEARITTCEQSQAGQRTELAVIHSNQDHLSARMDEVRELGLAAHRNLDEVRELGLAAHRKLDEVLREVKRP